MRERLFEKSRDREAIRITPARAGKTWRQHTDTNTTRDHPRSCGKDAPESYFVSCPGGSPPLVRERLGAVVGKGRQRGITPARAGKTLQRL